MILIGRAALVSLIILMVTAPAAARSEPAEAGVGASILGFAQSDTEHHGHPNVSVIDAAFVTAHDRITVYDDGSDMRATSDWRAAVDFNDDTWIFDIGSIGSARLIVQFKIENGHDVAYLWDDSDGDGSVSYRVNNGTVQITEPHGAAMRIESSGSWFRSDGSF